MNRSYTDDMNSSPPNYLTTRTFRIVRLFAIIFALLLVAYSLFLSTLKTGAIPDHTSTCLLYTSRCVEETGATMSYSFINTRVKVRLSSPQ